jgi:hypothetical protein
MAQRPSELAERISNLRKHDAPFAGGRLISITDPARASELQSDVNQFTWADISI